jgi:hypothetical protein
LRVRGARQNNNYSKQMQPLGSPHTSQPVHPLRQFSARLPLKSPSVISITELLSDVTGSGACLHDKVREPVSTKLGFKSSAFRFRLICPLTSDSRRHVSVQNNFCFSVVGLREQRKA